MTGVHGLAALRQAMTDYLTAQGVESMTAWPKDRVGALTAPLAVVQVKEVEAGSAGFQNYLGQRYDAESRRWTEAFGQKVSVKFLVTLYSPRQDGERGCRALVDRVAEALVKRAGELNSERVVLVAPAVSQEAGGAWVAAAVAGAICGGSDPALPLGGAELQGISALEKRLDESEVDALIRGGVTPVERVGGSCWVIRGVTTRTKTGQASDQTWRDLTTILVVDDVIPGVREALRARFPRAKNTAQTRGAVQSLVVEVLERKLAAEVITGYDAVEVTALADEPGICLVTFGFTVTHGMDQIWLSAEVTV